MDRTRVALGLGEGIELAGLGFPSNRCNDRSRRAMLELKMP